MANPVSTSLDRDTAKAGFNLGRSVERFALVGVWVAIIAVFSMLLPGIFFSWMNFSILFATQSPGKFRLVGKPFSEEKYGIGLKKGDTALCTKITDALKKMISDGSWQNFVTANLGPAGFKPGPGNPPTPEACT